MITSISNIDEINKIIRNELITQSELESKRILNGVSIHGQDLVEQINQYCYKSYSPTDSVIVFVLNQRNSNNNVNQTINNEIYVYSSYSIRCYTYGFSSSTLVQKIIGRMLTEEVKENLYEQGIYLESISDAIDGKEFVNETMFIRTDFDINISVLNKFSKVKNDVDIKNANVNIVEVI